MARESFDREIQYLRMLALTSSAYNRQQYAERLGISVHTYDKMARRLKEIASTVQQAGPDKSEKDFGDMLRYSYPDSADPVLLFLFRGKSLKESESQRLSLLLTAMQDSPQTVLQLLDICCEGMGEGLSLPDEKTIRGDLKYLEGVGVIQKLGSSRPYRYQLRNDWISELTADELLDLYDFVDIMANTQLPSVQGYLLRDSLKKQLLRDGFRDDHDGLEAALYKYHFYSRILDEAHLFSLLQAIEERRRVSFLYFTPKRETSYASRNTNPLYERDNMGKQVSLLPLKIVYDHQYGRWYLLGFSRGLNVQKFRMEGITQLAVADVVPKDEYSEKLELLERRVKHSWLIDTGRKVLIRLKFYNPGPSIPNFVKDRVRHQGQWGTITEEQEEAFIYEIKVNGTTEIKPWIRSFGSSCEVLEPAWLRQELTQEWKEIGAYYEPL